MIAVVHYTKMCESSFILQQGPLTSKMGNTKEDVPVEVLDKCFEEILGWMKAKKLKLSLQKTQVVVVNGDTVQGRSPLFLNGVP